VGLLGWLFTRFARKFGAGLVGWLQARLVGCPLAGSV
jgi:hypothetical protein